MIYYNFPYRGAFEYDKFVLNFLQYHNQSIYTMKELRRDDIDSVKHMQQEVDKLFTSSVNEDKTRELIYTLEAIY